MRKIIIGIVVAALVALGALGSSALAHPNTYTVAVGGSTSPGSHLFFAAADNPIAFSVLHGTTQTDMSCDNVNLEGEVESGTGIDPVGVVKAVPRFNTPDGFNRSQWKDCEGLGLDMTVVPLNDWEIHATGAPVSAALTDVVSGYVSGPGNAPLRARVFASSFPLLCDFEVEGYADGSFDEVAQSLTITETGFSGDLSIVNTAANCLGRVNDTDPANFEGVFTIGADDEENSKEGITEYLPVNLISSP